MDKLDSLAEWSTRWINKVGIKYYWEAEGHPYKFCNKHLANWYERERNCWTQFVSTQFSSIKQNLSDGLLDMDRNYNAEYLQKIRNTNDYIQFFFSGGSDSITVFEEAVDNNIFIDEVISLYIENIDYECNQEIVHNALPYIAKHKSKYGKFTLLNTSFDSLAEHFRDPYGFFMLSTAMTAPLNLGRPFLSATQRPHIPNSCYIKCTDKPNLLHYKGNWYATFNDGSYGGENAIPNLLYFWLEGDNIKSYIKDARLYRDYLKQNYTLGKDMRFFKTDPKDQSNLVIRKNPPNMNVQFGKNYVGDKLDDKYVSRFMDAIRQPHYDVLIGYYKCLDKFFEIFPETRQNGFVNYNNNDKFAWFINIDTLEVMSQMEMIPKGFQQ